MDTVNLIFGIFFLGLGLISLYGYITKNEKMFWKKEKMIKFWGKSLGTAIHFIGYVIAPIVIGIYFILSN